MIKTYREIHGCIVYAIGYSTPFVIRQNSLQTLFTQVDHACPKTFIAVGRKGIVNCRLVKLCDKRFVPEQNMYQKKGLCLEIPYRLRLEIKEQYASYRNLLGNVEG